jgi:hypothetical protein
MLTSRADIPSLVDAFTADLAVLIRGIALEAVRRALGRGGALALSGAGPRPESASRATAAPFRPTGRKRASLGRPRKKGQKRDPQELTKLTDQLYDYIKANHGQTMSVIQKALGTPPRALTFPVKRLRAAKRITSKGVKQATTYTAVAASNGGLVLVQKGKKPPEPKPAAR